MKKTLIASILSIVMCLSLIVGGTFALFTSTSTVNIAVTSGKVEVVATINDLEYKSYNITEWTAATNNEATFDNIGGSAILTNDTVTLSDIVPGDAIRVRIDIANNSSIDVKYKIQMVYEGELAPALKTKAIVEGVEREISNSATAWTYLSAGGTIQSIPVVIEFPDEANNDSYQEKSASISFIVHAVQGNADTSQVETLEELVSAIETGDDATLVEDIVLGDDPIFIPDGAEMTIDLNGKKLIAGSSGYAIDNSKGGTLYLDDSSVTPYARNNEKRGAVGIIYTSANSTTIVNGGIYNVADDGVYVFLNEGGKLIINSAIINGGGSYPIYSYNDGHELIINDVVVNGKFGCVNAYAAGTVTINGGEFYMTGVQGRTSHIAYFSGTTVVTINGGHFEKLEGISMSSSGGGGLCSMSSADITINAGYFKGDYRDVYVWSNNSKITIKSGEFAFNPTSEGAKIAEGSVSVKNADNTYTVKVE